MTDSIKGRSVCWLPALKEEGYASMDRYWLEFETWAARLGDPEFSVHTPALLGSAPRTSHRSTRFRRAFKKYIAYPSAAARQTADIFHLLDHSYSHLIPRLRRNVKVVATVFDLVPLEDPTGLTGAQVRRFRRTVEWLTFADHIISISEETKDKLSAILGIEKEKITVAVPGMDFSRFNQPVSEANTIKCRLAKSPTIIFSVGSNANRKNLRSLLPIFAELKPRFQANDCVFVRAGERLPVDTRREFQEILGDRFIELGPIFSEDLVAAYQEASIFIFPSTLEGLTFTIPEAMAAGCAVVTNRCTANPEAGGDAALYYDEGDYAKAAAILDRLVSDPGHLAEFSKRSISRARTMTWDRHFQTVVSVYRNLWP
jgi:glycosyltransferase involved in cell wall biosynthesis